MTNYQFIRKNPIIFISLLCLFIFGTAIIVEYGFKVPSCKLCVYQRIPYVLTILVGLLLYFFSKIRLYLILTILFQTLGLGISIFHSLIERGIIHYEMGCTSVKNDFESIDELRNFLDAAPITKCNEINFSFLGLSLANMNILVSVLIIFLTTLYFIDHEKKNNKKIDEILRVNHAGEFGAQVIYKSQIKFSKDDNLKKELKKISDEEMVHFKYFDEEIIKNRTRPTVMQPIWRVGGYVLGAVSSILGEKYVHACTEAVESTIVDHYNEQIEFLKKEKIKNDLRIKIQKFCEDENSHKENSTNKIDSTDKRLMVFKGLTKIATRAAIKISKQI